MRERFGIKDFVLAALIAVIALLQFLILKQRDHNTEALIEHVKSGQVELGNTSSSLKETGKRIADLTAATERQAGTTGQVLAAVRETAAGVSESSKVVTASLLELDKTIAARLAESSKGLETKLAASDKALELRLAASAKALEAKLAALDKAVADNRAEFDKTIKAAKTADARPRGDKLIWGMLAEPKTLNPITGTDLYSRYILRDGKVFETLMDRHPDTLDFMGVLAQSWEQAADGKTITIRLKPEATFSDGKPVTADDVIFSVDLIRNPKIDAANLRGYYDDLERMEKVDDRTVRFHMKKAYFLSMEVMGGFAPIMPKHVYGPIAEKSPEAFNKISGRAGDVIIGSGPYVFEKWQTGQYAILARNENYWGRKVALDKIEFRFFTNPQAALQELEKEEVDFIQDPMPKQYFEKSADKEFKSRFHTLKWDAPDSGFSYVGYNMDRPLFQNKLVRRAMTHTIDRETLLREVNFNLGTVANGYFWKNGKQADPNIKPWPFDPKRAKELLEEAGWKTGSDGFLAKDGKRFEFKFLIPSNNPPRQQFARIWKDELSKLGIDMTVDELEWSIMLDRVRIKHDFDVVGIGWGGGGVESDPFQIWHSTSYNDNGSNFIHWNNRRSDEMIEKARSELDEAKRNAHFHEFHRILHDEQPYTFMTARLFTAFVHGRFEGVKVHKLGIDPLEWYVPVDKQKRKG